MKIKFLLPFFILVLVSCSTPVENPTRTSIPDVDVVLDAVQNGDTRSMRELFQFTKTVCTTSDGLGGPPKCHDGEVDGTPVIVFPFFGSEGSFLREDEVDNWNGLGTTNLYAVFRVSENVYSDDDYPAGEYGILLLALENTPGTVLQVTGGKIVRIDTVFGTSEAELSEYLKKNAAEVLLRFQ